MYHLIHLSAICICVLPVIIAQSQGTKWKVWEYPNPRYQKRECGRKDEDASQLICDPDSVISVDDADEIEKLLENIHENTRCPCQECTDKQTGYVVMVALMNNMERIIGGGDSTRARLYDARVYSYYLSLYWNTTTCKENVLVLYSKNDDMLYTMTWKNARKVLTDQIVLDATIDTRRYFKTNDKAQIGSGLKLLLQEYSDAFMRTNDDRSKRSPKENRMKKYHQDEPIPVL
ncbi:hypothetical protein FSP39_014272 [Pinctada imbricata]|uniref:Uncharacterized protein n=1 Tax=Pinctada imbricata TaxID=66713 RepID=A0AA88Y9A3_PINIB|nr:hypothetical protein FSP39_014272 [Pinctada imbricata]